jgi:hypothetical protein
MFFLDLINDMLKEISQHQYNGLLQNLFFDVLVGKTFFNTFVKIMGKCCMWYGGFVKCVVLGLLRVQRNLNANPWQLHLGIYSC